MRPWWKKLALVAHILSSVGWMGAAVAYLVVALVAMIDADSEMAAALWPIFALIGVRALVPLAVASFLSGLVMALGTKWGLFRYYWIIFKLLLTTVATAVLVKHMDLVGVIAGLAQRDSAHPAVLGAVPGEVLHAAGGLLVLLTALILSVYKPRGVTAYGRRRLSENQSP